jgi:spore germination protein YaaH
MALICALGISAQEHPSIHQIEREYYANHAFSDTTGVQPKSITNSSCILDKRVFGWHPSWVGSSVANNYQWNLLSDLCYFNYEFNASTGAITATNGFLTSPVVDSAQAHGTKVHLCVTMFNSTDHTTFFGSTTAQTNLITNLINAVQARNADGINLDFEGVSSTHKTALTTFVKRIADSLHTRIPGAELTIAMPAVDWGGTWDLPALNPYVDLFIVMGYDYYYGGSPTAGPTDPLYAFESPTSINYSKTVTYYLNGGVTPSKLLMAVPYYGFQWQTSALTIPSSTLATGTSKTYATVMNNSTGFYSNANKYWEPNSLSNYWSFNSAGLNYQCWVDDVRAMGRRFDLINIRDIGGIGIWALGYDNGYSDFWDLIAQKFSNCAVVPCSDTIWDLGGPNYAHYANEDFVYTIAPSGATGVSLDFSAFDLEANYDSLWIYDGYSTSSGLIGAYSSTNTPGTINSSGSALTLRFHSDGATQHAGWTAIWNCSSDNIPPTTAIDALPGWKTDSFTVSFIDVDNVALNNSFWQVLNLNGNDWKGNARVGFLNENFNANLPAEWTSYLGTWSWNTGHLLQIDSSLSNTNYAVQLMQDSSSVWLYHYQLQFGAGDATANRRAGIHYFCSDVSQSNRENNYMAYFRLDNQRIQLYEYINNTYTLQTDVAYAFSAGVWYDIKVLYNPSTGYNAAWVNNELVSSWVDATPLKSGTGFSLRVGNSKAWYDDVKVYRSRSGNETVTVGSDSMNMVQWQNPNPLTPSCRIKSIVLDQANLFSAVATENVNIDYTPPLAPAWVNDFDNGFGDYDTLYYAGTSFNNARCAATFDTNSGVSAYYFDFGLSCGTDSMFAFTNATDTFSVLGVFGVDGFYYTYVYAVNGAGLHSDTTCSDGIAVFAITGNQDYNKVDFITFPNPVENELHVNCVGSNTYTLTLFSTDGKILLQQQCNGNVIVDVSMLNSGLYMLELFGKTTERTLIMKR